MDDGTARALVDQVRRDRAGTLLAVDFDGTLAPIVPDPATSRPINGSIPLLARLAGSGVHVSIVTGRDATTVLELGGLDRVPGVIIEGLYGAEQWHDGTLTSPDEPESIRRLRVQLQRTLADHHADSAIWIEDKRLSLVVHSRLAEDPDAALDAVRAPLDGLADDLGLEVHPGRYVLELRPPGIDKGGALRRLVDQLRPSTVVYIGDDLGDIPAFDAVAQLRERGIAGWRVVAASAETPQLAAHADLVVDGPPGVLNLLWLLAD